MLDLLNRYITTNVVPLVESFDKGRVISTSDSFAVAESGLLGEIFRGSDENVVNTLTRSIVRISGHCGNLRNLFLVNYGMVGMLLNSLKDDQETMSRAFNSLKLGRSIGALAITEESGGSNSRAFITRVSRSTAGMRLNGKKTWITLAGAADFLIVLAWVDDFLRFVYVPRNSEGVSVVGIENPLGSRGSALARVNFDNVLIEPDYILARDIKKYQISINAQDYVLRNARLFAGASGLGMGLASLIAATKNLQEKKNFKGSLLSQADWQIKISELYLRAIALKGMLKSIEGEYPILIHSQEDEFTPLKILGTQFAIDCSELLVKSMGAEGYSESSFANRIWRESIAGEFIEGGNVVLKMKCAQNWMRSVLSGDSYAPF